MEKTNPHRCLSSKETRRSRENLEEIKRRAREKLKEEEMKKSEDYKKAYKSLEEISAKISEQINKK